MNGRVETTWDCPCGGFLQDARDGYIRKTEVLRRFKTHLEL